MTEKRIQNVFLAKFTDENIPIIWGSVASADMDIIYIDQAMKAPIWSNPLE
jgi:hypothetical protein